MRAAQVAVPETEAVELLAVAAVELGEIAVEVAGLEQARLHLGDRRPEGVAEPREARRRTEIGERGTRNDTAQDQRPLGVAGDRAAAVAAGDPLEDIVEGPDRAAEQCAGALEQVALDPFDVRSGRHDQHGLAGKIREIAIEE